jgi:RNA polymerase sigma-70 factor (ECF subfamily)
MDDRSKKPTGSSEEDAAWIKAFRGGDRSAFDRLVLKHKDMVFNVCYRFLGDYEDANDCAQDAFVRVYRSLDTFRFESAFATWLYRVTVNTCRNRLKSAAHRHSRKNVSLEEAGLPQSGNPSWALAGSPQTPMAALEKKERAARIQGAIDSLAPERRMVVVLRDIEGLSYEEISLSTGLTLGTVKSRLSRARLDLRQRLRKVI